MPSPNDDAVVIIPARIASTRIPGKPLADLGGLPMVVRVLQRAREAKLPATCIVATDDERIRDAVAPYGEVRMTGVEHESGTDRVAEVARELPHGLIINVQGDLPLLDPSLVDRLIERLREDRDVDMATVAVSVTSPDEMTDPGIVKIVCDRNGRAMYFSRAPIPLHRDDPGSIHGALHHVGLYGYRRETLLRFAALEPSALERMEKLEQLRALENGIPIGVVRCESAAPMEVDTPEDLEDVRAHLSA